MTMFKLKNCDDVTLTQNETTSTEFLEAENTTNIKASENKAGFDFSKDQLIQELTNIVNSLKDVKDAASLTSNIEDLTDELNEDQPTQSRVNKWLTRISQTADTVKLSSDTIEKIRAAIVSAKLLVTSLS
ncbi:hypothetical protein NMS86_003480 [Vibrio cholerae]|uniref:hypothetical protein n=1 Tax=Vibrio mimicus TaxID=674 RepID=UPI0012ACA4A3|nr:hypothetical protein [Vibrio mimicus]EJL6860952.1 hypothetical protein [Vibrio cholerae]